MDVTGAAEQRLADALRARAVSGGYAPTSAAWEVGTAPVAHPAGVPPVVRPADAVPRSRLRRQVAVSLLVALLAGLLLGAGLGLLSMLVPGLLPAFG